MDPEQPLAKRDIDPHLRVFTLRIDIKNARERLAALEAQLAEEKRLLENLESEQQEMLGH